MQNKRIGLYISLGHPLDYQIKMARYAEKRGFSEIWTGDLGNELDGAILVSTILANTKKARVGTAILPIYPRNPLVIANMWSTMVKVYPERSLMLGLGAWFEPMISKVGIKREKPIREMREYVEAIKLLFSRQEISYYGKYVHIDKMQLDPNLENQGAIPVPVYIGATGPKMHILAGKVGDGVIMNYMISPDYVKEMMPMLKQGAASVGRSIDQIDRPELIAVAMSSDRKQALTVAKKAAVYYLGYEPHIQRASGASKEVLEQIHKITTWPSTLEKHQKAMDLIPDELVQNMCAAGTPKECLGKIREFVDAGCTCPIISPLCPDIELLIDKIAKGF